MHLIYLARHAKPDRTRADLPYHLIPGPPLTDLGRQEAAQLGEFFRQVGVGRIIASPLERCLHTARIAAEIAGASVEIEPTLIEWQPGEKSEDVQRRMLPVFTKTQLESDASHPTALVMHGGPIGALLEALGMDRAILLRQYTYDYGNPVPTAGVWRTENDGGDSLWRFSLAFVPVSPTEAPSFSANTPGLQEETAVQPSHSPAS